MTSCEKREKDGSRGEIGERDCRSESVREFVEKSSADSRRYAMAGGNDSLPKRNPQPDDRAWTAY